jgi:cobalt-zinc-cadmium efflux system membrane fusion protein
MGLRILSEPVQKRVACAAIAAAAAPLWLYASKAGSADPPKETAAITRHLEGQVLVPENSPLRRTLSIQPVAEQVVQAAFTLPATVEADPAKWVKVLPPVAGRIVSLDKQLGDATRAGDVLFRLESADLAQAFSDSQKAQAALALTQKALGRQKELAAAEISSARDVEQAQSDFDQARSETTRATDRLAQLGAAAHGAVDGRVLAVRSPIAGHVVELTAARGAYWNDVTAALMTVADLSSVFITSSVDERNLGSVHVGQSAKVAISAYPDQPLDAKVRYVGELLDPDTRRVKVRMLVDNKDGRLKPGMFATATFLAKAHRGLLVPQTAVVQSGFYSRVFVEVSPWRFEPRVVQLGAKSGADVEIVTGIKAHERVVVKDGVLLDD